MSKDKNEIVESAIAGGVIGAALGAIITGRSKETLASIIVGAAIGASLTAFKNALKTNIPILFEDNGSIYKLYPNGKVEFIRTIEHEVIEIPETFSLD